MLVVFAPDASEAAFVDQLGKVAGSGGVGDLDGQLHVVVGDAVFFPREGDDFLELCPLTEADFL